MQDCLYILLNISICYNCYIKHNYNYNYMNISSYLTSFIPAKRVATGAASPSQFSRFTRIGKILSEKAWFINNIFEHAQLHNILQRNSREKTERVVRYLHQTKLFIDPLDQMDQSCENTCDFPELGSLMNFQGDEKPEYTAREEIVLQLAGPITTMSLYGMGSVALGIYAHQLPLSVLIGLTWGSFRWNEAELIKGLAPIAKGDLSARRLFNKSGFQFLKCFCILFSFYLLLYIFARAKVSSAMTQKIKEHSTPYEPACTRFLIKKEYSLLIHNKEEIMERLTEDSCAVFSKDLEALGNAIKRNDLEEMQPLVFKIRDLIKVLPIHQRNPQFLSFYD